MKGTEAEKGKGWERGERDGVGGSYGQRKKESRQVCKKHSANNKTAGAHTRGQNKSGGKRKEWKRWAVAQKNDRGNTHWAGCKWASNRMIAKWTDSKRRHREKRARHKVRRRPRCSARAARYCRAISCSLASPRANWHLQCEKSSLCTHCHSHTAHKHTHIHTNLQGVN